MLVVEDVHHMDEASADLLQRLSRAAASLRQILLVTHSEPGHDVGADTDDDALRCASFTLLPLSQNDMVEIVAWRPTSAHCQPHDVEEIARRSGGSPLFLFELLDMVRATGRPMRCRTRSRRSSPATSTGSRPPTAPCSGTPSVLGASFDEALLSAALGDTSSSTASSGNDCAASSTRTPRVSMRFRNTLVRDAAYEGLPFRLRRDLHAHVGEAIEARRPLRRRRGFDARSPFLRSPASREGVALLPHRRRPGACDRGPRRSGTVLRRALTSARRCARRRRPRARRRLGCPREPSARRPDCSRRRSTRFGTQPTSCATTRSSSRACSRCDAPGFGPDPMGCAA